MNGFLACHVLCPTTACCATGSGQNGFGSPHGSTFVWKTARLVPAHGRSPAPRSTPPSRATGAMLALACWLNVKLIATQRLDGDEHARAPRVARKRSAFVFSPDGSKLAVGAFRGGRSGSTPPPMPRLLAHLTRRREVADHQGDRAGARTERRSPGVGGAIPSCASGICSAALTDTPS